MKENPIFGFLSFFHGRHFENDPREVICTQIVTVNIIVCNQDLYYSENCFNKLEAELRIAYHLMKDCA